VCKELSSELDALEDGAAPTVKRNWRALAYKLQSLEAALDELPERAQGSKAPYEELTGARGNGCFDWYAPLHWLRLESIPARDSQKGIKC
jgi:hypothetical protein